MTIDTFFAGKDRSREIFEALRNAVEALGEVKMHVGKSQITFHDFRGRTNRAFAWAWMPEKYLRRPAAPLVLTVALHHRDPSPRWKQVVQPYPGRFTHHMELYDPIQIDAEVVAWLEEARGD